MTTLNPDILEETFTHFNIWAMDDYRESLKCIEKFMNSGKESYDAALRYFSTLDSVTIDSFFLRIYVKRMVVSKKYDTDHNLYKFPFDFPLMNDILKAVVKVNKKLEIENYPMTLPGRQILAKLIQKDLKFIGLNRGTLPADYYKFLKDECKFVDARLALCCSQKAVPVEFFELTAKHHTIVTHFENFLMELPEDETFPAIEDLCFKSCPCQNNMDYIFVDIDVIEFLTFLSKYMPNLKKLDATFLSNPIRQFYNWQEVYDEMLKFKPSMFETISPKFQGYLSLRVIDHKKSFNNAVEEIGDDPPVEINNEKKQFIKEFDIRDGLSFKFALQFDLENDSDDENFSNEYDDDFFMKDTENSEGYLSDF